MKYYYHKIFRYVFSRLEFVSNVSMDIAQIFFGILAVESFTKEIISWWLVSIGVILSSIWWIVGIITFQTKK